MEYEKSANALAEAHVAFGQTLQTDVGKRLAAVSQEVDTQRKKIFPEALRKIKVYQDLIHTAVRAETYYQTHLRELKDLAAAINESKETKQVAKFRKMATVVEDARKEYELAISNENKAHNLLFTVELPKVAAQCFELLDYQATEVQSAFTSLLVMLKTLGKSYAGMTDEFETVLEQYKQGTDLDRFKASLPVENAVVPMTLRVEEMPQLEVKEETPKSKWGWKSVFGSGEGVNNILQTPFGTITIGISSAKKTAEPANAEGGDEAPAEDAAPGAEEPKETKEEQQPVEQERPQEPQEAPKEEAAASPAPPETPEAAPVVQDAVAAEAAPAESAPANAPPQPDNEAPAEPPKEAPAEAPAEPAKEPETQKHSSDDDSSSSDDENGPTYKRTLDFIV